MYSCSEKELGGVVKMSREEAIAFALSRGNTELAEKLSKTKTRKTK